MNIAALNSRCGGDGPRRMPSRVQEPTRAAPTGPQSTTAASDAMLLADQARPREFSRVAEDSHGDQEQAKRADLDPVKATERADADHRDCGGDNPADVQPRDARELAHASPKQPAGVDPNPTNRRRYPQETPEALIRTVLPRGMLNDRSLRERPCQDNVATGIRADLKARGYSPTSISAWTCLIRTKTLLRSSVGTGSQPQCVATRRLTASSRPNSRRHGPHSSRCCRIWSQSSGETWPSRYQ